MYRCCQTHFILAQLDRMTCCLSKHVRVLGGAVQEQVLMGKHCTSLCELDSMDENTFALVGQKKPPAGLIIRKLVYRLTS